jgi:predicted short-subunit dehydrogenase-like oxidoreductase (DUF2520 family)
VASRSIVAALEDAEASLVTVMVTVEVPGKLKAFSVTVVTCPPGGVVVTVSVAVTAGLLFPVSSQEKIPTAAAPTMTPSNIPRKATPPETPPLD